MATNITRYNSLDELLEVVETCPIAQNDKPDSFHGRAYGDSVKYIRDGADESEQVEARELIAKVNAKFDGRTRREWAPSVSGPRVSVPGYLAGHPLHMQRRQARVSAQAPVRVVVETLVSHDMPEGMIRRRGAAIAALISKLSETRPVELWAAWGGRIMRTEHIGMVKLESKPISLAYLCAILNSREFSRSILLAHMRVPQEQDVNREIKWAWNTVPCEPMRVEKIRNLLKLMPQDIFIPGGRLDRDAKVMINPMGWVDDMVVKQRKV